MTELSTNLADLFRALQAEPTDETLPSVVHDAVLEEWDCELRAEAIRWAFGWKKTPRMPCYFSSKAVGRECDRFQNRFYWNCSMASEEFLDHTITHMLPHPFLDRKLGDYYSLCLDFATAPEAWAWMVVRYADLVRTRKLTVLRPGRSRTGRPG